MNWVDYRERLGIGFGDAQKYRMVVNRLTNSIKEVSKKYSISKSVAINYFNTVGELYMEYGPIEAHLINSFNEVKSNNLYELVSKYIAFVNSINKSTVSYGLIAGTKEAYLNLIIDCLHDFKIPFDIISDEDGIFIFPKGVKELDDALVNEVAEWLKGYPDAEKAWIRALRAYGQMDNPNSVADLMRKALETFFQCFFSSNKSLENLKSEYGTYLGNNGIPSELVGNLDKLLNAYTNYMNNYVKHHDKTADNVLEYLLYETGNIIRLLISLKKNSFCIST